MKNIKTFIQMKLNNGALLGIKLFSYLFIAILLIISVNTYAQSCANYVVTRDTAVSYSSIAGTGSSLFTWRNTTSNQNDDNRSYQAPIGFDFWYLGVRYTQFSSDLNGFIDFSSSTSDGNSAIMSAPYAYAGNYMNVFSTANASMLALAPMYDDIWTAGSGTAAIANSIVYKTTGTAPNRILTVEWINFDKYGSSSGSINFQIKLYETSGIIEFVYGSITAGSAAYVYCSGINGNWTTGAPTAAQLLTQQTANTNSFSNTAQNNLSVKPVNNSRITFTPPATSAAPSNLTFTAVAKTGTTLNWNDNATNEVGYVIYNSTDNVNYNFVAQTSSNTTSYSISGLSASTLYFYKVYAVSEGKLSSALTGSQITLAAGAIASIASGNWGSSSTWNCACIPTSGDIVTIANGHTVTLDTNGSCSSLIIGQGISGQLTLGNNTTSRSLTIGGDLTVYSGATIIVGSNISTHTLSVLGNIVNNGTINFAPTATRVCNLTVNKNGNQTVSGTGNTNNYNLITVNLGSSNTNTLEITSTKFSASTNFLTLTNGTFKLSSAVTITPFTAASTITSTCGLWMNNSGATINLTGGTISLLGYIRATSGTINIGNASDQNLTSNGGTLIIEGGTMNIAGRLDNSGISALTYFTMSSGQLTLATSGSTTALLAPFNFTEIGSTFNFSGGTIVIRKPGSGNLGYVNIGGTNGSVSGGTIQIGDALTPASQTIQINSSIAIPNLVIGNSVAVTAQLNTNPLTINNNISINSGLLNSNSLNISLGGNFTNNGSFTAGTGTVILNGTSQTLTGNAVTFNNLTIKNSGVKTLTTGLCTINGILSIEGTATVSSAPTYGTAATLQYNSSTARLAGQEWITPFVATGGITNINTGTVTLNASKTISSSLILTAGKFAIGANTLTLNGNFSGTTNFALVGGSSSNLVIGNTGTIGTLYIDQTTVGTTNRLQNFSINRNGSTITLGNIFEITGTVTLSNGTLASAGFLTLVSNNAGTARIGSIIGTGAITGNVTIQRFIPGGLNNRAYRFLASPVSGQTFSASWQQDIHITGPGTGGSVCPNMSQNSNGFDNNASTISSIYTYSEISGAWTSISNTNATSLNSAIPYRVFIRGNRSQGCSLLTTPYATPDDVILKSSGTLTTGTVNTGLTYTVSKGAGWNLVTNPYPSAIDWNNPAWVSAKSSNISSTIYIWNPASGIAGQYASWNPVGGSVNGGSNIIQSGQSFFVKTTSSATLSFQESYKSSDQTSQIFGKTVLVNNLKIQLKDSAITDEAVVFTYAGSTHNIDNLDGQKMSFGNGSVGTYTTTNDTLLTFNALEPFNTGNIDTVFLKTGLVANKSYALKTIGANSFINNYHVYLVDKFTSIITDLSTVSSYFFTTNSGSTSYNPLRFYLIFADPSTLPVKLNAFSAVKQENKVILNWNTSSEINSSSFIIERSNDAINFIEVTSVKAAGNSSQNINYSAIDFQPNLYEVNYYRIKQIDVDGKYSYSSIAAIDFSETVSHKSELKLWPNPASNDYVNLSLGSNSTPTITVMIIDVIGRVVEKIKIASNNENFVIPVNQLNQGAYLIKVYSNDKFIEHIKLVKE